MGAGENECQISQNYIFHMKFSEIICSVFIILVKFDVHFLRLP